MWVYFWTPDFVPLVHFIFMPVPYCFDNCSFVIWFENKTWCFRLCSFSVALAIWVLLWFHTNVTVVFNMWKMPLVYLLSTQHHHHLLLSSLLYQRREAESCISLHCVVLGLSLPMRGILTGYVRQKIRIGYYDSVAVAVQACGIIYRLAASSWGQLFLLM